jgi:hypothetical protein
MSIDKIETERFHASFSIYSSRLDFEALKNGIGIVPTHSHNAGDLDFMKKPYEHDKWLLKSPLSPEETLNEHLKWLADQLKPYYDYLRLLKQQPDVYIYIYCGYTTETEQSSFSLSAEALSIFVDLNIGMELHVLAT